MDESWVLTIGGWIFAWQSEVAVLLERSSASDEGSEPRANRSVRSGISKISVGRQTLLKPLRPKGEIFSWKIDSQSESLLGTALTDER